jgi:type VI protein secretion system component VasA
VSYDYEYRYMRELARSFVEVTPPVAPALSIKPITVTSKRQAYAIAIAIMSNADRLFRGETV